jgi:hypothetical protein
MINKKTNKIKTFLSNLIGVNDWKLNAEGHLDINADEMTRLTKEYGADFVAKFEKLLQEETAGDQPKTKQPKSDMLKLEMLCALLAIQGITLSEDGNASLSKEQLEKIEAGLKKLQDEKTAAESALATAKTEKDTAVGSLSAATTAMDELDATVAAAKTPAEKVEAIRTKLAAKPAVIPAGTALSTDEKTEGKIEGKDEINSFAQQFKS